MGKAKEYKGVNRCSSPEEEQEIITAIRNMIPPIDKDNVFKALKVSRKDLFNGIGREYAQTCLQRDAYLFGFIEGNKFSEEERIKSLLDKPEEFCAKRNCVRCQEEEEEETEEITEEDIKDYEKYLQRRKQHKEIERMIRMES